jgi:osmoprotectant transport system ATP-binding protein
VGLPVKAQIGQHTTLHDALSEMLISSVGCAVVVDDAGRYEGVVDIDTVMNAVNTMRAETRERVRVAAWHTFEPEDAQEVGV